MAEPASALTPLHSQEGRLHDRTHMFVAATLYSDAGSCPVHIRNMSLNGALIEGSLLPDLETPVTLRRGSLEATAMIVWRVERKAGVAFAATIQVADWMSRNPPSHQARVDEMLRGIRSEPVWPGAGPDDGRPVPANSSVQAELQALKVELAQLENGLCGDIGVAAAHPEIQLLDIARQRVDRLLARAWN